MIRELEKSWKTPRFLTGKARRVVSGRGWSNNFDSRHVGFKMPQTHLVRDAIQSGERCLTSAMHHTRLFFNQTDVLLLRDSTQYIAIISLSAPCCAKLLLSRLTLCDPMVGSLPGSSVHGIFPGKNTGVGCRALLQGIFPKWVKWKSLSRVWLFAITWTSPWNSPGQNTGMGRLYLLQGICQTQELNPSLPHCRQILYQLSHKGSPTQGSNLPLLRLPFKVGFFTTSATWEALLSLLLLKCFPIFPCFFLAIANPFHLLSFQLKTFLLH